MRLTRFTEHTLRTLMYLAAHPGGLVTIAEIANTFQISANHLMKVVQHLAAEGAIVTMRGQHGRLRLAHPADSIRQGHMVRRAEPDMELLPHLDPGHGDAEGADVGAISTVVSRARDAFLAVLDEHRRRSGHRPRRITRRPEAHLQGYRCPDRLTGLRLQRAIAR